MKESCFAPSSLACRRSPLTQISGQARPLLWCPSVPSSGNSARRVRAMVCRCGNRGEQIFFAPNRIVLDRRADVIVQAVEFTLQNLQKPGDVLLTRGGAQTFTLCSDHDHDLPAPRDQFAQQVGLRVLERTYLRCRRLDEMRDHRHIDRICLGPLTDGVCKCALAPDWR